VLELPFSAVVRLRLNATASAATTRPPHTWPGGQEPPLAELQLPGDARGPPAAPPLPLTAGALSRLAGAAGRPPSSAFWQPEEGDGLPPLSVSLYVDDRQAQLGNGSRMAVYVVAELDTHPGASSISRVNLVFEFQKLCKSPKIHISC
jgi:hypothetical protein